MKRHYFISNNLDDLELVETELEKSGLTTFQIHVLSERDAEVKHRKLHEVVSLMKKDVVRSTLLGAAIGVVVCVLTLSIAHVAGLTSTTAGWMPFIFLGVVLLGFCTWEGGLRGIQEPNHHFLRFQKALREGRHIFFVDVDSREEKILNHVITAHPGLEDAGIEPAGAHWVVEWEQRALNFIKTLP